MASPELLHPALWRADQLGSGCQAVSPSGFEALDAVLPGGGWPHGVLTELLLPHAGVGEMRLLAAALTGAAQHGVMLFDPPGRPCAWALGQLGVDARHWLVVRGREVAAQRPVRAAPPQRRVAPHEFQRHALSSEWDDRPRRSEWDKRLRRLGAGADVLWALEQALKSGHLGAVLAWLPLGMKSDALRRLQLAAQSHDGPVFIFRESAARQHPSVAPLRLLLGSAGVDALWLRILKRRGPALSQPLQVALPTVLTASLRERAASQALSAAEGSGQPPVWAFTEAAPASAASAASPEPRRR